MLLLGGDDPAELTVETLIDVMETQAEIEIVYPPDLPHAQ